MKRRNWLDSNTVVMAVLGSYVGPQAAYAEGFRTVPLCLQSLTLREDRLFAQQSRSAGNSGNVSHDTNEVLLSQ
jgi:hypothetical protein